MKNDCFKYSYQFEEKEEIKTRAEKEGLSVSSYARNLLFLEYNAKDIQDNTVVIQEKDERISDLKIKLMIIRNRLSSCIQLF